MTTSARLSGALMAAVLAGGLAAGCGSQRRETADKAGGNKASVVLRLAAAYNPQLADAQFATYFATQVERRSGGKVRLEITFDVGGGGNPFAEVRVAELVESGRYELGWIGARAWDELGVKSFQALQAPFLITSYPVLERVAKGPIADEMLAGLTSRGVRGLALIPGLLRHPARGLRPLVSFSDFAGARIHAQPSRASDALFRALGAVPVHQALDSAGGADRLAFDEGSEVSFANPLVSSIVSANVTFFPKVLTLFVNEHALASLDAEQRRILEAAARQTLAHAADFPLRQALAYEGVLARSYCKNTPGRIALADDLQLRGLVRATLPVFDQLERDQQTRRFIAAIRRIKASLPPPTPIKVPAACTQPRQSPLTGVLGAASLLNGTYHWKLTKAAALAFGPPASVNAEHSSYPILNAVVLRNGRAQTINSGEPLTGTYSIRGNRITLFWTQFGYPLTFAFRRDPDRTLHLKAVQPMDRGDEFVWSGGAWRWVGPPVVTP
jgi:TRAP-type C4-dicarboxylate transport system substrate-binding protein